MIDLDIEFVAATTISSVEAGFPVNAHVGNIVVSVTENDVRRVLVDVNWNFDELMTWFVMNTASIEGDQLPAFVSWHGSIYASIEKAYQDFESYSDEQLDELFDYRTRHELCFGLRGIKIPVLYIGLGQLGMEVSGEVDGVAYRYPVEADQIAYLLERPPL